jgi:Nitroreductase
VYQNLIVMPFIIPEKCTRCLKCVKDCPANAIDIETYEIADTCIQCGHCVAVCSDMAVRPDFGDVFLLQPHQVTPKEFRNLSSGVRSCRSYLPKDVPDAVLLQLTDNMRHYPSASNARPLNITIVRSKEKVKLLNDLTEEKLIKLFSLVSSPWVSPLFKLAMPSTNIKKIRRYRDSFIARRDANQSQICYNAPAVVLFHGEVSKTGMAEADANIWAANTSMYANTLGLATCFNGFIVKAMDKRSKLNLRFNVPSNHKVYAALLVGYPKVKYRNETSRQSPSVMLV